MSVESKSAKPGACEGSAAVGTGVGAELVDGVRDAGSSSVLNEGKDKVALKGAGGDNVVGCGRDAGGAGGAFEVDADH